MAAGRRAASPFEASQTLIERGVYAAGANVDSTARISRAAGAAGFLRQAAGRTRTAGVATPAERSWRGGT